MGDQLGFIKTTIAMALERPDMHDDVLAAIYGIIEKEASKP
ncbi:hypothetical protein [Halobacillus naozhouensis]|uniref:Uncharacterized protein n=1 Tax=Halobacillus naozhouensis TaxID=554880 RepID=A0ABY8IYE7_9BACI|nr:hypothetical protein [Halobacillus naozhouensis]WFT73766.1 hypothetical protein P9989_15510 [Halobacillus naozhouensis]